jgi:membrane protease YdiL (CAAX protease family)
MALGISTARSAPSARKEQMIEVSVFLFLIVPSMLFSFFAIRQGSLSFLLTAWATILRDLGLVALVAFFLWRNAEPIGLLGWSLKNAGREIVLGVALWVAMSFVVGALGQLLRSLGLSEPSTPLPHFLTASGPLEFVLAAALVIVVAVAEETIFRGYLILRLASITRSTAAAVVLSAIIFSLGHGYEGTAGVIAVGVMGLIFALVFVWRQSLVAPIVMHFLQDFIGIVVLPLLGHKH